MTATLVESLRMAASIRSGLRYIRYAPNLQASLLSYRDVFYFVAFVFSLTLPLILLLNRGSKPPPPDTEI